MKRFASFLIALMVMLPLAACGGSGKDEPAVQYGRIGDTMSTEWFDFVVTDAYSCGQYRGHTPSKGYKLVVATVTLKNTCGQPVEMWRDDFALIWGDDGSVFDRDIPLAAGLSGDQFPDEYILDAGASRTGVMVFEAPQEFGDFSICFVEFFEPDAIPAGEEPDAALSIEEGDTFLVEFSVEDRG